MRAWWVWGPAGTRFFAMSDLPALAGAAVPQPYQWLFQWSVSLLPCPLALPPKSPVPSCVFQRVRPGANLQPKEEGGGNQWSSTGCAVRRYVHVHVVVHHVTLEALICTVNAGEVTGEGLLGQTRSSRPLPARSCLAPSRNARVSLSTSATLSSWRLGCKSPLLPPPYLPAHPHAPLLACTKCFKLSLRVHLPPTR